MVASKAGIALSALEEEILTLLINTKAYGLEIIEAIATCSEGHRATQQGTIYPILKRLEQKQYILAQWGESFEGARRKYYQITSLGINALEAKNSYRNRLKNWTTP